MSLRAIVLRTGSSINASDLLYEMSYVEQLLNMESQLQRDVLACGTDVV